jgi:hypothetical protein
VFSGNKTLTTDEACFIPETSGIRDQESGVQESEEALSENATRSSNLFSIPPIKLAIGAIQNGGNDEAGGVASILQVGSAQRNPTFVPTMRSIANQTTAAQAPMMDECRITPSAHPTYPTYGTTPLCGIGKFLRHFDS